MKRILITGANSYIGTSFEKWMQQFGDDYQIDTIDMHGEAWKEKDFSLYDSIFHVAGIAHADVSKVSEETKQLYYKVNCDLAVETAEKYKKDLNCKVGQFIYMSSIIVYGENTSINKKRVISRDTEPNPSNFYGDSKLKAEKKLMPLNQSDFKIVILRPPMIYGNGSKGNYQQLIKIANKVSFFPNIKNERSMIHIDTLCDFIKNIIDTRKEGLYFPQDKNYVRTSYMVRDIGNSNGKKIYLFSCLNWLIYLMGYFPGKVGKLANKAFGSLVYSKDI
ncbi:NAD-dependent epimerase/dehydratase family protein [Enterococcus casseliflavus]|uniref:NAD-dependent epimerase/dehydratase family protein n=1 Tax=Enterococcus casseliflavus TaxID=37734 RepID=UPI0007644006|nr:NAD-dependent epimerase/dehydratase family protein [Enterococcus casseliflavus]QQU22704.1 NAD-dependent epimerase/dehydratase family protein [Enterococcus casseliflavus]STQ30490.1 UDP-glucose 4-epimerase [Enterococcus casseliflavus]